MLLKMYPEIEQKTLSVGETKRQIRAKKHRLESRRLGHHKYPTKNPKKQPSIPTKIAPRSR